MKEHLHLFTDVNEKLPSDEFIEDIYVRAENRHGAEVWILCNFWNGKFETDLTVTHWLDLSALTTKLRAITCISSAYMSGIQDGDNGTNNYKSEIEIYKKQL